MDRSPETPAERAEHYLDQATQLMQYLSGLERYMPKDRGDPIFVDPKLLHILLQREDESGIQQWFDQKVMDIKTQSKHVDHMREQMMHDLWKEVSYMASAYRNILGVEKLEKMTTPWGTYRERIEQLMLKGK